MLFSGRSLAPRRLRTAGLVFVLAAAVASLDAGARPPPQSATIARTELPSEALATERSIRLGGPFSHEKDGSVFGNREQLLPSRPRGHYREYTVDTPGARDRGPRRIVCGGHPPTVPEACYYTDDHYASFRRIVQ